MIRAAILGAALLLPAAAQGQAFTQLAGEGRIIATTVYSASTRGYDDNGDTRDIPRYDRVETYLIAEYGVTDDLTLLATPSLRHVSIEGQDSSTGIGFVDLGARYKVVGTDRFILSGQASLRLAGGDNRDLPAQIGVTDTEYDVRGQAAVTFGAGSFVIVEAGHRWRDGDPPNEIHVDATLGFRVAPRVLLTANSFNTWSDGQGRGAFWRYRYHNAYLGAAYDVSRRVTVQVGGLGTLGGRNALRERGLFAGVWFRF